MNWPNRITIFRMILVPVFIMCILYQKLNLALAIFIVATITDALDGYIARKFNQKTKIGAILDPIADKMLIGSAFISLSMVSGLPDFLKMPVYVPMIIISRDFFILLGVGIIYFLYGKIDVKPTNLSKVTTLFQMLTIIFVLIGFPYSPLVWNLTVVLTVMSGLDYLRIGSKQINEK